MKTSEYGNVKELFESFLESQTQEEREKMRHFVITAIGRSRYAMVIHSPEKPLDVALLQIFQYHPKLIESFVLSENAIEAFNAFCDVREWFVARDFEVHLGSKTFLGRLRLFFMRYFHV